MTTRKAIIDRIAREALGLETLESRRSDSLDFHEHAVWSIQEALERAYEAGLAARQRPPTTPTNCPSGGQDIPSTPT
jgi:hypothetical protein